MPDNQEFPENRAKDQNGAAAPTEIQIKEESASNARIAREQAEVNNPHVAGHDFAAEHAEKTRSRKR